MKRSVYLATNENAAGKRMVALGVMETATRRFERVAFFRPVIRDTPETDQSLNLMVHRYKLDGPLDSMTGLTRAEARQLLAADQYELLLQRIQERFKAIEERADFVLVEGTSFQGLAPEIEFELNADIAVNLGCPVLPIYSAAGRSVEDTKQSVRIGNESLRDQGAYLPAIIVNRVPPEQRDSLRRTLEQNNDDSTPLFLVDEEPLLRQPTLREIQVGLNAKVLSGDETTFDREVSQLRVAAMQLPTFAERLRPGSLVITPGDRSDIVAGCVLAAANADAPSPTGLVLTGGLVPPPAMQRLTCDPKGLPILTVDLDTFTTAEMASRVRAEIGVRTPRKVESAIGVFEQHVGTQQLAEILQAPAPHRMTPLLFEYSLIQRARAGRKRIVLPEGNEPRIVSAVDVLCRRRVADLILLGKRAEIEATAGRIGVSLPSDERLQIIDPSDAPEYESFAQTYFELRKHKGVTMDVARDRMQEVSYFGTMMVYQNLADGMVSGAAHTTANTIRPAFEFIKTPPGVKVVSSVFLMCLKDRVLVYGDCAVIPNPTAEQLVEIARSSADTARQFGIQPRVAMLSYSTGDSGHGEDVKRVREATRMLREAYPDLLVEGPIQYDAAIDPAVAAAKLPGGPVAGRATVFVFPDLNTGNNTYKAVQRSAGALAIGPVLQGLNRPVNDLSRGCTVDDIVNTVAITAIQAQVEGE
ncbi:MAG: phosphate acetyltransferase [Planctomycetota bacterium]